MRKLILISFLFLLLNISFVVGQSYQQGVDIDLKIPFIVNGTIPSASAICNLSVQYPNASYIVANVSMTNGANGFFNYTLPLTNVNEIGEHNWFASCCETGGLCSTGQDTFDVTVSGFDRINSGEGLTLIASLLVMSIVCAFLFIISMRFNSPFAKFSLMVVAAIILVIIIFYSMVGVQQSLGGFGNIVEGYATFFSVLKYILGIAIIALILLSLLVAIRFYKFKRGLID